MLACIALSSQVERVGFQARGEGVEKIIQEIYEMKGDSLRTLDCSNLAVWESYANWQIYEY